MKLTTKPKPMVLADIKKLLEENGRTLTKESALALKMADSPVLGLAQAWMSSFFDLVGDKAPNREEIHLDSFHTVHSIYSEYVASVNELFPDMFVNENAHSTSIIVRKSFISFSAFNNLWRMAFSHVKLRVFKQV